MPIQDSNYDENNMDQNPPADSGSRGTDSTDIYHKDGCFAKTPEQKALIIHAIPYAQEVWQRLGISECEFDPQSVCIAFNKLTATMTDNASIIELMQDTPMFLQLVKQAVLVNAGRICRMNLDPERLAKAVMDVFPAGPSPAPASYSCGCHNPHDPNGLAGPVAF